MRRIVFAIDGSVTLMRDDETLASLPANHLLNAVTYDESGNIEKIVDIHGNDNSLARRVLSNIIAKTAIVKPMFQRLDSKLNAASLKQKLVDQVNGNRDRIGPAYVHRIKRVAEEKASIEEMFDAFESFLVYY